MKIRTALREFDWKGWLGWVMATMTGIQLVAFIVFSSVELNLSNGWWGGIAMCTGAGTSLGICQWLWLRRRLVKAWQWIIATLIGWYLVVLLAEVFVVRVFEFLDHSNWPAAFSRPVLAIVLLAIPLAFSLPQWFVITRQFQKAAWWWIVARPFAWLAGYGLIASCLWLDIPPINSLAFLPLSSTYSVSDFMVVSIGAAVFGFGFAAVTGIAFTWIQTNQTSSPTMASNTVNVAMTSTEVG